MINETHAVPVCMYVVSYGFHVFTEQEGKGIPTRPRLPRKQTGTYYFGTSYEYEYTGKIPA